MAIVIDAGRVTMSLDGFASTLALGTPLTPDLTTDEYAGEQLAVNAKKTLDYVAPIVEAYIPDASIEEKLALTAEFLALFDALYEQAHTPDRFDSLPPKMVESDSHEVVVQSQNL